MKTIPERPPAAPVPRTRTVGYLSGAPRVSTRADAQAAGPRSHILGTIHAFEELGWEVESFIAGDRVPGRVTSRSGDLMTRSKAWALLADLIRLGIRPINARRAWRAVGPRVDWVYERFATFQALGAPFKRRGVPWILETQGLFYEEAKAERKALVLADLARRFELGAYRACDAVVCVSHALKDAVVASAGIPEEKVLVVPNGVDTTLFDPKAHVARREFDGLTIVYVGSLLAWQRIDDLLLAMSRLPDEHRRMLHLVVAGDGPTRLEWEALAASLGLAARVRFVGAVRHDEVPALIAGADIGYAGHAAGSGGKIYHSPLKIYEYLAMGRPVLATRSEDAESVIAEGQTGFLFAPGDQVGLQACLERVCAARSRLGEMGRAGRAEIVQGHSWVARVRDMIRHIDNHLLRAES